MKRIVNVLFLASVLTTACTKQSHGSDDLIPHQQGVEDNPNGGGGNNVTLSTVPAAVTGAFTARYPGAVSIQWKKLSDGNFKAEFMRGAVKWQAIFTPAGTLVKEEHN